MLKGKFYKRRKNLALDFFSILTPKYFFINFLGPKSKILVSFWLKKALFHDIVRKHPAGQIRIISTTFLFFPGSIYSSKCGNFRWICIFEFAPNICRIWFYQFFASDCKLQVNWLYFWMTLAGIELVSVGSIMISTRLEPQATKEMIDKEQRRRIEIKIFYYRRANLVFSRTFAVFLPFLGRKGLKI